VTPNASVESRTIRLETHFCFLDQFQQADELFFGLLIKETAPFHLAHVGSQVILNREATLPAGDDPLAGELPALFPAVAKSDLVSESWTANHLLIYHGMPSCV
jgi:hypothetical protein